MTKNDEAEPGQRRYYLRLYIAGVTPRSRRTVENLQRICSEHLQEPFDLEIIDIYQQPELASVDHVVAAPTLLKIAPLPLRRIVGDLSNERRVLHGLSLEPTPGDASEER